MSARRIDSQESLAGGPEASGPVDTVPVARDSEREEEASQAASERDEGTSQGASEDEKKSKVSISVTEESEPEASGSGSGKEKGSDDESERSSVDKDNLTVLPSLDRTAGV